MGGEGKMNTLDSLPCNFTSTHVSITCVLRNVATLCLESQQVFSLMNANSHEYLATQTVCFGYLHTIYAIEFTIFLQPTNFPIHYPEKKKKKNHKNLII